MIQLFLWIGGLFEVDDGASHQQWVKVVAGLGLLLLAVWRERNEESDD
jgi:hypothetical protein